MPIYFFMIHFKISIPSQLLRKSETVSSLKVSQLQFYVRFSSLSCVLHVSPNTVANTSPELHRRSKLLSDPSMKEESRMFALWIVAVLSDTVAGRATFSPRVTGWISPPDILRVCIFLLKWLVRSRYLLRVTLLQQLTSLQPAELFPATVPDTCWHVIGVPQAAHPSQPSVSQHIPHLRKNIRLWFIGHLKTPDQRQNLLGVILYENTNEGSDRGLFDRGHRSGVTAWANVLVRHWESMGVHNLRTSCWIIYKIN